MSNDDPIVQIIPAPPDFWIILDSGETLEHVSVIALSRSGRVAPLSADLHYFYSDELFEVPSRTPPDWVREEAVKIRELMEAATKKPRGPE